MLLADVTINTRGAGCRLLNGYFREMDIHPGDIILDNNWEAFTRPWIRPAAIKRHMKSGTHFKDFET